MAREDFPLLLANFTLFEFVVLLLKCVVQVLCPIYITFFQKASYKFLGKTIYVLEIMLFYSSLTYTLATGMDYLSSKQRF